MFDTYHCYVDTCIFSISFNTADGHNEILIKLDLKPFKID